MKQITCKKCNKCGDVRPTTKFDVHPQSNDGYRHTCRDCISLYSAKPGPKPKVGNVQKAKKDQLAYHPNQSATLAPYYKKIIGGQFKPRDPNLTPSRTIRWSDNKYWQEKPMFVRETGNKEVKSRGL